MSLDVSLPALLVLCGDQQGNVVAFRAPAEVIQPSGGPCSTPLIKGAWFDATRCF